MSRHRAALVITLALLCIPACGTTSGGGGTNTNWLPCDSDSDCGAGRICVASRCVARDASVGNSGATASGGSGGTSDADAGGVPGSGGVMDASAGNGGAAGSGGSAGTSDTDAGRATGSGGVLEAGACMSPPDSVDAEASACTPVVTSWGARAVTATATVSGCFETFRCWNDQSELPPMNKSCRVDADCYVATHVIDCCGSVIQVGLNVAERDRFATAEQTCEQALCFCMPQYPEADDGRTQSASAPIDVACCGGLCRTFVAGPDL